MTKKILIAVGALVMLVVAGAAWARGPGHRMMMKQMISKHVAAAEDYIQATPDQRAKIDASVNNIVGILQAQRQAHGNMHKELVQLLTGDTLTADQVNAVAKQHADQLQALASKIAPEIVNVHDVLTPVQRQKLAARAEEMREKHQQHQGGFGGPGE
jgi:Spy/CpxP family protein refolding chaperone